MKVEEKVIELIMTQNEDLEKIDSQSNLIDMGYNSLNFIELVVKSEVEFEIEFNDDDLDYHKFNTVKDFVDYIEFLRR
ncbi:MAG: phosphopantetheine-binding protein [Candidatus Aminicenantes bacterium]|jgi:acyl carrier protein